LLYKNEKDSDEVTLKTKCAELERYLILHAICNATTKNYNKECVQFLNGETPDNLLKNCDDINEQTFNAGLKELWSNKLATLLLFWIELYKRANDKTDIKELKYSFTLEHIMPQKWNEYWGVDKLPVVDESGNIVQGEVKAKEIRGKAVYNIGNMTLLNSKLNTSLRNYDFKRKVEGEGKKKGMKLLGDCFITKEILNKKVWDEKQIYERTTDFADCIKTIWNIKFN
jgi:hypothetical protein